MKIRIALFMLAVLFTITFIQASALDTDCNIVTIDNTDVLFDINSSFTFEEQMIIAQYIVQDESKAQTYGLICNLLGHKNSTEIVYTITHKVNSTVPRCKRETWEVIVCSRCDNVENNLLSYSYIDCCPVD